MDAPPRARLADLGINHGLVIGQAVADWRRIDLSRLRAVVMADGRPLADLTAAHTAPDLMALAAWLVGHVATSRGGIAEGTWITTGSWSSIRFVDTPADITGTFDGVGSIEVRLA
jgi:2-keto-4-pentenoate hydratase